MRNENNEPNTVHILHIVGGMNRGGVETWLMHVLRHIDRSRFQMDFLVHTNEPCAYDEEIRALGSRIIPCLHPSHPLQYARNFKRILCEYGPYDVVHSHVHHYSGFTLWLAHQAGVPVRIAHSHSDTSLIQAKASSTRRVYLTLMRHFIERHSTCNLAASQKAAAALFGAEWQSDPRNRVLYYGIDFAPFKVEIEKMAVRAEFGIPADAFVVGHVGRFVDVKNHRFIIQIVEELVRQKPEAYLLLVGDGPLRPVVEQQVREAGLTDRVIFTGLRNDVPRMMMGGMDIFLMPSFYEGLPMVLIEAQAAGLPCIVSDTITDELDVVKPLFTRLPLTDAAVLWVNAIVCTRYSHKPSQPESLVRMKSSVFSISKSLELLESAYANLL